MSTIAEPQFPTIGSHPQGTDSSSPFEEMMSRFDLAAQKLGLDPFGELRNVERGKAISRAIQDLPADFRELIALRHFAGLSYEEIAGVKNMPLGTVKNKLFRARAVLRTGCREK